MCRAPWPEACAVAVVAVSTAIAIRGWPSFAVADSQTLAAWAGATATFSAAVVALGLGLGESRKRWDERRRTHRVYRWLYQTDVGTMLAALQELECTLPQIRDAAIGKTVTPEAQKFILTLADQLLAKSINNHIDQLRHLALPTGEKLARLAADGPRVARMLGHVADQLNENASVTKAMQQLMGSLIGRIAVMQEIANDVIGEGFGDPETERAGTKLRVVT